MATFLFFHAHPDDEVLSTGGTIARAAAEGNRVVLVVATNGEYGEVPDDLADGETLIDRRRAETQASAGVLGVDRIVWLGYRDSGMTGWAQNDDPRSFVRADLDEAAERLAAVLREERADLLSIYDWHGNYGHPDHIRVHQVGHRAAELAGTRAGGGGDASTATRSCACGTISRRPWRTPSDRVPTPRQRRQTARPTTSTRRRRPTTATRSACREDEITLAVDIRPYLDQKRRALLAHRSQVTDTGFFLQMPDEVFARSFGTEWFIEKGVATGAGPRQGWLVEA